MVFSFDPTHGTHYRHGELHIVVSREHEPVLRRRLDARHEDKNSVLSYSCGLEETTGAGIEVYHKAKDLSRTMKVLIRWKYDAYVSRELRVRYPPIKELELNGMVKEAG